MKKSRRDFLKNFTASSLGAIAVIKSGGLFVGNALAKTLDTGIKKMKYIHSLKSPLKGAAKGHQKKLIKALSAHKDLVKGPSSALPVCKYCKFWEDPKDGYGWCRYVAKKNNSKGQKAFKDGWCQMFKPVVDAKKLSENLKA